MPSRKPKTEAQRESGEVLHTDVVTLNSGLGGTETQTNVLVPSPALASLLALGLSLRVEEDVRLLLERTFRLDGQLGGHGCEISVRQGSDVELDKNSPGRGVVGGACGGRRRC